MYRSNFPSSRSRSAALVPRRLRAVGIHVVLRHVALSFSYLFASSCVAFAQGRHGANLTPGGRHDDRSAAVVREELDGREKSTSEL